MHVKKHVKAVLAISFMLSTLASSVALAGGLGGVPSRSDDNQAAWWYFNDDDSMTRNEWRYVRDNWYYFGDDGISLQSTWAEIDGKWYYFDQFSIMLHDTTTPDGYAVGSDGAWIQ